MTEPIPTISLESLDGSVVIPLDNSSGWIRMPGATGLQMAPVEVISSTIPGVPGTIVQDVRVQQRPVFIPIYCRSDGIVTHLEMLDQIRSLIDPTTHDFRIVGTSPRGAREMIVRYDEGLEGADGQDSAGLSWCKIGLKATAHEPFARALEDSTITFLIAQSASPFLGVVGGTDSPWPSMLSSNTVIGNGMEVEIESDVPVYPTVDLIGPMDSFLGEMTPVISNPTQEWSVDIPSGVAAGSILTIVTDPRRRSIRLDGTMAASRVSRGSKLRPFYPGFNVIDVAAPGGTGATQIVLTWRNLFWSLW